MSVAGFPALISTWWQGITADHLYWYCPQLHADTHERATAGRDTYCELTAAGLHPQAGGVCEWCAARYQATIPCTEQDVIAVFSHASSAPITQYRS